MGSRKPKKVPMEMSLWTKMFIEHYISISIANVIYLSQVSISEYEQNISISISITHVIHLS